ncbi:MULTISPECIES: DUF3857 domain-containing transglutaminase family protein [Psychrilyobacter]|uniref:DUF3857 domain-containing protein n=1 Tax=Psychrilyobacter piezotolerans TaxID=2293438 RepID=A0ABX9KH41_9FUSO|nr:MULTISPECIES: DUF3857 and transglutaminase domain-containing protein [Psychrilyobacter]MCS5421157.1 DUF3857 and transglutaminase domain-containing protein [Psychrilyobacter sp. S5]NDI77928.1 DUF3857 and transglutaminase domain-containing protein [Psychrilyobacter piezotolerans]RDE62044.1 DUF3857 domain-containing protein [Psychrilyobacter sp. S5]REI41291.1 DUF3857 domain-containing protein [Psychrilyobacter piezotolerans]
MIKKLVILLSIWFSSISFSAYIPKNEAIKILSPIAAEDYAEYNEVYIVNSLTERDELGGGTITTEIYKKVLNTTSKKDNSLYFDYDANYSSLDIAAIELIKADGKVIKLDPKKILEEKINGASQKKNIYTTQAKTLSGNLPNLEIGDIIYTKAVETIKKARIEGHFSGGITLENSNKFINNYEKLTFPKDIKLYVHELNKKGFKYDQKRTVAGDKQIYEWNIRDNPLVTPEPNMDDASFSLNHIEYTTIPNWEYISKWSYELVTPHLTMDDDIREKVRELTKDAKTRDEKIENIFYWVARNIRYLGVDGEKNRPGLEPHDISYTFKTRGGVCRDKATLLSAMLNEAGIKSDTVLISSGSRISPEVPIDLFNHMITMAYDESGEPLHILDPTNETTKDFLPKYEEDNSYLISSRDGDRLRSTPVSPAIENNSSAAIDLKLDSDYNAVGTIEFIFSGIADGDFRSASMRMNKYDLDKLITRLINRVNPGIITTNIITSDPKNMDSKYTIKADIEIPEYGKKINDYIFIPFSGADPSIHFMYEGSISYPFSLADRKYDFKLNSPTSFTVNYRLEFPESISNISIPKPKTINYAGFKTVFTSKVKNNTLDTTYYLENSKIHFPKEKYQDIKKEIGELSNNNNLFLIKEVKIDEK